MSSSTGQPGARLGTMDVFVAGVALVVASSTLVSEFTGFFTLGWGFVVSLALAFVVNLLLALSSGTLSAAYPRSGALYDYARAVLTGHWGRRAATFLGLAFFGMGAFAVAGETASGAHALSAVAGPLGLPITASVVTCLVLGTLPNLLGVRTAAWASAGLLVLMLGLRWFFGLAGFFDWSQAGSWSAGNLVVTEFQWFGSSGVVSTGLALGIWSFVGIEFACSMAADVRDPRRSMPRGMILGLIAVLATTLVMGIGVSGAQSPAGWSAALASRADGVDAPQLAVGAAMFGAAGVYLMGLASLAATLGSLTIIFAATPRVLMRLAEGGAFGRRGAWLGLRHGGTGAPVPATLVTLAIYLVPALASAAVVDWVLSAAYVWILLYAVYHVLAYMHHRRSPERGEAARWWQLGLPLVGVALTLVSLGFAFGGQQLAYGGRAAVVLCLAAVLALVCGRGSTKEAIEQSTIDKPAGEPELVSLAAC